MKRTYKKVKNLELWQQEHETKENLVFGSCEKMAEWLRENEFPLQMGHKADLIITMGVGCYTLKRGSIKEKENPQEAICEWTNAEGYCKRLFRTNCGRLSKKMAYKYCPYCGKPIEVVE